MIQNVNEPSFALFLYGSVANLKRAAEREGKRWAAQYGETKTFPTPFTESISAGTVVWTNNISDLRPEVAQWRTYFTRRLAEAIDDALDWENYAQVNADFEAFTLKFPWGALDAAVAHVFPNSIARVSRRIESVLTLWMPLDSLRYVDRDLRPIDFAQLMRNHYGSLLEMWLDRHSTDLRTDLKRAVDVMQGSREEVVRSKVVAALSHLAREDARICNRDRFGDPVWLSEEVSKLRPEIFDNMATGYMPDLLRNLIIMDESIGEKKRGQAT